jgi:integrase
MGLLAASGGLRAGEISRVHSRDLVGDELVIHGKGGKVRAVPIVDERLLAELRQVDGWAFPNGYGSHLTPGHVSRLLSEALPDGWTAHTLRHRCASVAYAATRDLLAVGALLGHSRPETTQRYVAMPDDAVRAAARAASSAA